MCIEIKIFYKMASSYVHDFLAGLTEKDRHKQILSSMFFPKTTQDKTDGAKLVVDYECKNGHCDFSKALEEVSKSVVLNDYWCTADLCVDIIKDIESYPDDYLPDKLDGFYINRLNNKLVHLSRKGAEKNSYTGYIEYSDLKNNYLEYLMQKKIDLHNSKNVPFMCFNQSIFWPFFAVGAGLLLGKFFIRR